MQKITQLSCSGVRKKFGSTEVLKGISLEVSRGEIFGLLGLNGAGKTTLIRCLTGLINPSSGGIRYEGLPLAGAAHKFLGFLPESFLPPLNLTAREFLRFLSLKGARNIEPCLEQVGLAQAASRPVRGFSRGMIQRLGLAAVLIKQPEVIILDEPTLGLDPAGQTQMISILREQNRAGKTIFFSSHTLSQVEKICTRIGVINAGRLSYCGTVGDFLLKHSSPELEQAFLKEISYQ